MVSNRIRDIIIKKRLFNFSEFHNSKLSFEVLNEYQLQTINKFNNKVRSGEIEFESVPCLCGGIEFDNIASVDGKSFIQQTMICRNCGLIQSNPRMTDKQYREFYESDFYRISYEGTDFSSDIYQQRYNSEKGMHIFKEIENVKSINSITKVIEIGAGGGWNLIPFIDRGAPAVGIDYSPRLVQMGIEHGINMRQGGIEEINDEYDIIIINHVLEHFLDPVSALKKIVYHLKNNGIIYIAVPNILNFSLGQLQNAHSYYFTPASFQYYISTAGLRLLKFGNVQNIHMFGIFSAEPMIAKLNFPEGNYEYMVKFLRNQKYKILFVKVLKKIYLYQLLRIIYRKIVNISN